MKYFNYKAVDNEGALQSGCLTANSIDELDVQLRRVGLELVVCRPSLRRLSKSKPIKRKQLIDFTFHLQQMVEAGVPIVDSLKDYCDTADHRGMAAVVTDLVARVESGEALSNACAAHKQVFSRMFISMLQAGEESGQLVEVLRDLLALLKWQDETVSSIRRVLIYPAFVVSVLALVIGFVMTWLVPSLTSFIESAGGVLPWHTRWLIAVSEFITGNGMSLILILVLNIVFGRYLVTSYPLITAKWHALLLRLPLIGAVVYKIKVARFCRCSALMYASGINLIDTLKHGERLVDNMALGAAIQSARGRIIAGGGGVSESIAAEPIFPPLLSRLLKIGETTGGLDRAFMQTSYFYDRESRESIERLEQFIGPALIVIVGSIMCWVVVSVIGPIYDLVFSMQGAM